MKTSKRKPYLENMQMTSFIGLQP